MPHATKARPVKIAFPATGGTGAVNIAIAVRRMPGSRGNTLRFFNDDGPAPVIVTVAVPQSGG
ncbi:hypothetical protein [Streptomyces sp. B21-108]|jgi:hypothetical protein|uniref:hypothetical protein n=1 Tax=Streptomyces sp. B21-108 TaxID=3039419 RepID=UPI002FEE6966